MRINQQNVPDEKQWFTRERNLALSKYDDETKAKILELEKKFGSVCFTPLDIPVIQASDHDKFVDWFFKTAKPSIKQNTDIATQYTGNSSFLTVDVLPPQYDTSKSVWSKNVIPDFNKQWPDLWEQFYEYLPYDKIIGLSIWSSTIDIAPHRDQSLFIDLPLEFRTMIHDPNPKENLFSGESLPNAEIGNVLGEKPFPKHLDTNTVVWSNLRSRHYSRFSEQHRKIIMIFHYVNKINWNKYEKLLESSISRYRDNALISEKSLSDYVYE